MNGILKFKPGFKIILFGSPNCRTIAWLTSFTINKEKKIVAAATIINGSNNPEDYELASKIYIKTDDLTRGNEYINKAIELDPKHHQAFSSLGYILRKTGDLEGALKAYNQALKQDPNYAEALEYRAEAYLMMGRLEDMKKAYGVLAALHRPHAVRLLTFVGQWADGQQDVDLTKSLRAWSAEKKEKLGEVKTFVEKW